MGDARVNSQASRSGRSCAGPPHPLHEGGEGEPSQAELRAAQRRRVIHNRRVLQRHRTEVAALFTALREHPDAVITTTTAIESQGVVREDITVTELAETFESSASDSGPTCLLDFRDRLNRLLG